MTPKTETLVSALRILSVEIQSGDGVANAVVAEAADRLTLMANLVARHIEETKKDTAEMQTACETMNGATKTIQRLKEHIKRLEEYLIDAKNQYAVQMEGVQMTTQQSNTKLTMPIEDTIILDSKKCNAELLTIHSDGRITVAEHLQPSETAALVLECMRTKWMADAQSIKTRDQQERIKRLEEAGESVNDAIMSVQDWNGTHVGDCLDAWRKAKEANP